MIDAVGVENLLFQLGWKSPKAVPMIFTIIKEIEDKYHGSVNLEHYLNLMSKLLPSELGTSTGSGREKAARSTGPVWDMWKGSQ